MVIQQKENENLAAYIHCFKRIAKWCIFDYGIVEIHIFLKDFGMHTTAAKFMKSH